MRLFALLSAFVAVFPVVMAVAIPDAPVTDVIKDDPYADLKLLKNLTHPGANIDITKVDTADLIEKIVNSEKLTSIRTRIGGVALWLVSNQVSPNNRILVHEILCDMNAHEWSKQWAPSVLDVREGYEMWLFTKPECDMDPNHKEAGYYAYYKGPLQTDALSGREQIRWYRCNNIRV